MASITGAAVSPADRLRGAVVSPREPALPPPHRPGGPWSAGPDDLPRFKFDSH